MSFFTNAKQFQFFRRRNKQPSSTEFLKDFRGIIYESEKKPLDTHWTKTIETKNQNIYYFLIFHKFLSNKAIKEFMVTKIKKQIIVQGEQSKESLGLVHVITGDGKGKTTAALGLALRAIGNGYKAYMIQFLKSGGTGELYATKYFPNLKIEQFGVDAVKEREKNQTKLVGFTKKDTTGRFIFQPDIKEKEAARLGFEHAKEVIQSKEYDVVILDEINCVLDKGLIQLDEVIDFLKQKKQTEIIMTGRDAPKQLYDYADYVSQVTLIKNPWQKGIKARKGVEY